LFFSRAPKRKNEANETNQRVTETCEITPPFPNFPFLPIPPLFTLRFQVVYPKGLVRKQRGHHGKSQKLSSLSNHPGLSVLGALAVRKPTNPIYLSTKQQSQFGPRQLGAPVISHCFFGNKTRYRSTNQEEKPDQGIMVGGTSFTWIWSELRVSYEGRTKGQKKGRT
jgi:hypothetical protein